MNIAIVGAGITGISTALELAQDGHQVTVYEQMNAAAEDASFAPGGWLAPACTQSLAAPGLGMPIKQLQSNDLLQASSMIGSATWRWMRQWKKHEKQAIKHQDITLAQALHTLTNYSSSLQRQYLEDGGIHTEHQSGALVLLRSPQELEFWQQQLPSLQAQGLGFATLNAAQVQALEPGLGEEIAWLNALHFPQALSINPRLWAHGLRTKAQSMGVRFHTGAQVQKISTTPVGLYCNDQLHRFDAVIVCTGAHTSLLAALGVRPPLMPIYGYSISAPVRDPLLAPRTAMMDWGQQAMITRMGQRVRISAGLEMDSTANAPHHQATLKRMYRLLNDWFPGGVQLSSPQVQVWRGARGYLPDGLPAVGSSLHPGIWLNIGHGSHGVSFASGCARALADMVQARPPAIDMQAFSPARF